MRKTTFLIAVITAILLSIIWELNWRNNGYKAYHEDNDDLWAIWRRTVPALQKNDIIIVGSSRAYFDINTEIWEKEHGVRPVMLASVGTSPGPIIEDLATNTNYNGTLFISVAPDLFFGPPESGGWQRLRDRIKYFEKQTYAQRLNQFVYMKIDPHFSFINPHLKFKTLVDWIPITQRDSVRPPLIWPDMSVNDKYRNLSMVPEMEYDTAMQNAMKNIWDGFGWSEPDSTKIDTVIGLYVNWITKIKNNGGNVIFIRPPSSGKYIEHEHEFYPREKYWNVLLEQTNCTGYHFEDYEELKIFICPEWSHLLPQDADVYTFELLEILKEDGHI